LLCPPSPLRTALLDHERTVERYSVEPDSVLKERYGRREDIRHYIDLEVYNRDTAVALSELDPSLTAMRRRVGETRLEESGTLPWTIESTARSFANAMRKGDCSAMYREAGYLAHYVGDASQPLHTTIHFDGYRHDRGIHARLESAVDDEVPMVEKTAAPEVKLQTISGVWPATIAEIGRANALVKQTIEADRKARKVSRKNPKYAKALFADAGPTLTRQVADAASTLASIYVYEWRAAGSPNRCTSHSR
jgi:hypothetical protein